MSVRVCSRTLTLTHTYTRTACDEQPDITDMHKPQDTRKTPARLVENEYTSFYIHTLNSNTNSIHTHVFRVAPSSVVGPCSAAHAGSFSLYIDIVRVCPIQNIEHRDRSRPSCIEEALFVINLLVIIDDFLKAKYN